MKKAGGVLATRPPANDRKVQLHSTKRETKSKPSPDICRAIDACLRGRGDSENDRLFLLARTLKGIPKFRPSKRLLREIIDRWYDRSTGPTETEEHLRALPGELARLLREAKAAIGAGMRKLVAAATEEPIPGGLDGLRRDSCGRRLAAVCREMARERGGGPFPLSKRQASLAMGVAPRSIEKALAALVKLGLLRRVEKGVRGLYSRKANVWEWLGDR